MLLNELEEQCQALAEALGHAKNRIAVAEEIMSGQSGQLIVQNMGKEALNCTLFQKEQPKANDRAAMFPKGFGCHVTDPEWIQQKRALEDETRQKEVDKEQRKARKANKKARKVELEERWRAVCVAHEKAVASLVEEDEEEKDGGGSDEPSDSDDE
ncbi:hypothetical protein M413DRAFT_9631 [Hebeloma cylindrosporum]|uniref:Uncharacterized protein n=1 Tax=Hebeloma cylindrosporum TaxID=76867 RepID=A0A0C3C472_HEBCY|nr:hypothetical protein M413DRAFT_9631 [Hebeloma cylindrosporum h7]